MTWLTRLEEQLGGWLAEPAQLREISAALREFDPILVAGGRAFVTRHDDVLEVLGADESFGVTEIYANKMARTTGPFFLGMENTAQYRREVDIARRAARPEDAGRIRAMVEETARALLDRARARAGRFDGVADYSRAIPIDLLSRYFGVPGPDPQTMMLWMRAIFWEIFLNPNDDSAVSERARVASEALRPYLASLIAARRAALESAAPAAHADDFVTRLVKQQAADPTIDDDRIRRDIGGVIVGAVDTQSKAIAHVVDFFLRNLAALESARSAALAGDDAAVASHVWEALRFNPHNPALFRRCHADTVIAGGTSRRATLKAGTQVVVLTLSAMFDPAALDRPDEFLPGRPDSAYLHFGYGQHTCFGARINGIVVPAAVKALLLLDGLAYDEEGSRRIEYEGPFPDRMKLRFSVPR
jgi:cytochrome P450